MEKDFNGAGDVRIKEDVIRSIKTRLLELRKQPGEYEKFIKRLTEHDFSVIPEGTNNLELIMRIEQKRTENSVVRDRRLLSYADTIKSRSFSVFNVYPKEKTDEEEKEISTSNEKIISEILQPDAEKKIDIEASPIIVLSPINEKVLEYLCEHPEAIYQLSGTEFENVMAEIYAKLGYDVTKTQKTRDGGKDIIIRKPEMLGDFIYYVECKKYAPERHVGVGIVRNFAGTVSAERVNGGILATTTFFTKEARQFILENKLNFQIQMHDYDKIKELLAKI